jgi:hypothetical protein
MRAITRNLHKVQFYRETQTDLGPLLSHSETPHGTPIVRSNTPRPETLAGDDVAVGAFLIDDSLEEEIFS